MSEREIVFEEQFVDFYIYLQRGFLKSDINSADEQIRALLAIAAAIGVDAGDVESRHILHEGHQVSYVNANDQ